ncbi:activator of 2-hydroxyglutaryl-CoA dehydratase [Treponema primitia ZAS-2]|uniref:Activator of 2-hydroxyglutaryl-CoA dehydratase n=1 Tax=Treponema primitia (strain ATCC BAA-887 / DSM 12427 / ZAS-2) TaxID=545694 RepID=F5YR17_TREPZ|nr:acyl-CoA dehydratase activase [Treponema primitia]AEF84709.1 activator of 2-hydroxyglutaryl-CoA dehydratase [Treponema primitia ZAS-2]
MQSLGINIGSTSLKMVLVENGQSGGDVRVVWSAAVPHEGDFSAAVRKLLSQGQIPQGIPALVTGNEGRFMFNAAGTLEPLCVESALRALNLTADAVVSMGGEDLVVYSLNKEGKIINNFSGNKCASGTGEFLKQQLARMDMTLDDIDKVPDEAKVYTLSTRCSVFMKSDCTHRLNKREATKDDIVLSLSDVMAVKVIDFLKRAKIRSGRVVLAGGITLNRHIIRFIREKAPHIEFIIPETASVFEALGAAALAPQTGSPLPSADQLLKPNEIRFGALPALKDWTNKVKTFDKPDGKVRADRKYILGVDGGSTTTKASLVDMESDEIVASHYGRTHGDPVKALKECLKIIQDKIIADTGDKKIDIRLVSTTGSSREILGVFLETPGVYNEIIAHAVGTTYFDPEVETIFEIGGQDAKYVLLKNGVPIDYAMNEACSAGTGSFLEESAAGDLSIHSAKDIGPIALNADAPLKFGEHCSAFINSDIRKAVQQGATKENITAGIVCSIVANYLNRVVGNRTIGGKIFLQGGVAKNVAVPLAFAMMLDKEILVPPSPELTGCFGVALLAKRKNADGLLDEKPVDIDELLSREIGYERVFTCQACDNRCPIQVLSVGGANGRKYMFGGRCNKYTNMRKAVKDVPVFDYVEKRQKMLFEEFAAPVSPVALEKLKGDPAVTKAEGLSGGADALKTASFTAAAVPKVDPSATYKRNFTVGIPRAFSVHTLYPLYSWFFHELGIQTFLSTEVAHAGVARAESTYCFPAEIAHGAVQDCLDKGADYVLLPHFRDMPSYEDDVHANFCPITQSLPYYIEKAFPDVDKKKWLPLVVSFKFGEEKALELFTVMTRILGISDAEAKDAFDKALAKQYSYFDAVKKMGEQALADARKADRPVIAVLGRPYNAFTPEANMGIPRKFTTRGYSIIPFDILPFTEEKIFPNMYWYYGQQDVKSAALLKNEDNIYVTYVTNFSCAPDSFILHYLKWFMGQKPFLVLELDSHSADAGVDTRVEAFLDIIDGYRAKKTDIEAERYSNGWRFVAEKTTGKNFDLRIDNDKTGEKVPIVGNKRVKVLLSSMGAISTEYMSAAVRHQGINAVALPVATSKTIQLARAHASGKECVPSHLVLGGALQFFFSEQYRKDELYLLFVPITTGPCRTGQYYVYYENLFKDLRLENVVIFILSADNSYGELGGDFVKEMWRGFVLADYLKDIQTALKAVAVEPEKALTDFEKSWRKVMHAVEFNPNNIWKELEQVASDVKKIPLKRKVVDCPKVLVVGEIYVRRDDFAVGELTDLMSERGIVVKVAGIAEWIHYLDFVREYALNKLIKLQKPGRRLFSKPWRDLKKLEIEEWWKHSIEKKTLAILEPTGLIPKTPHDMHEIMEYTQEHFVNLELNSEIAVSSGAAAAAMEHGYSGIVNISPFACLIGRVIEGLFTPWARERNYPILSVEVDGNLLPPNIVNKLNIFMVNVLRFKGSSDMSSLVDKAGSHNKRFDIYSGTNDENGNGGAEGVKAKAAEKAKAEKELAGAGR